jgi:hypothetical protein
MTAFDGPIRFGIEVPMITAQSIKLRLYFAFIPSKNQNNESDQ